MLFHPRPNIKEKAAYQPGSEAEVPMLRVLNAFINEFFERHDLKGWKVLDAGCGRQPFRQRLEENGCMYCSMDVNQNPEESVQYLCALDETLPAALLQEGPFDLIICLEVLEHVADWNIAFKNFALLLKPGGHLLITTPHFFYLHEEPYDFWRATPYTFEYFGNKHGLQIQQFKKAGNALDILETILSGEKIYPKKFTFFNRTFAYLMRKSVRFCKQTLISNFLYRHLDIAPRYYLSNQVLMVKNSLEKMQPPVG